VHDSIASGKGRREVLLVFIRELREVPCAALQEHWRDHAKPKGEAEMNRLTDASTAWQDPPITNAELLLGVALLLSPILLGVVRGAINRLRPA